MKFIIAAATLTSAAAADDRPVFAATARVKQVRFRLFADYKVFHLIYFSTCTELAS